MMIIFGSRLYGKTDHVPGLFYVSTRFFHINYLPLVPTGSWLVMDGTEKDDGFSGCQIGLSFKSMLLGWLRASLLIACVGLLIFGGIAFSEIGPARPKAAPWCVGLILVAVICMVLLVASYRLTRASQRKASLLAIQAGIPPEVVAKFFAQTPMEFDSNTDSELDFKMMNPDLDDLTKATDLEDRVRNSN